MSAKNLFVAILGVMVLAVTCQAVLVSGNCYLQNQTNHAGTKVKFAAVSPSAVTDSVYTDASGAYSANLAIGVYNVLFRHNGYDQYDIPTQLFAQTTSLADVTLLALPQGIHLAGNLSGVLEDTIYIVDDDVTVPASSTLTIRPGAIFYFMSDDDTSHQFTVHGTLRAIGTPTDSIKFLRGIGAMTWEGIQFTYNSYSNQMAYCVVSGTYMEGIDCDDSDLNITHSILENFFGGIGISHDDSEVNVSYCTIKGDSGNSPGVGIYSDGSHTTVSHCLIYGNLINGINIYGSDVTIANSTISGSTQSGIHYYQYGGTDDSLRVINSIVANHGWFGINFYSSNPHFKVIYNDFFNNASSHFSTPHQYLGQIVTVNANGDSSDAYYNIFEDPLFVNAPSRDFHLLADSPCIDAGDPHSPLDPDGTIADMGAFYFDQLAVEPSPPKIQPSSFVLYPCRPNPFNPSTVIRYQMPEARHISLKVFDTSGRLVATLVDGWRQAGVHEVTFDPTGASGSGLASGMYFVRMQAEDFTGVQKMMLLK